MHVGNFETVLTRFEDAILEYMTIEDWRSSIEPKVRGSWNLHELLPQGLDFFTYLSSLAGIVGSDGQANFAAGNTYIDALVRYHVASGQKAASLDLGWMESEGLVAESSALSTSIAEAGHMIRIRKLSSMPYWITIAIRDWH